MIFDCSNYGPGTGIKPKAARPKPSECSYCEYDRKFPETRKGGWIYMGNGSPIQPCPICNPGSKFKRC